MIITIINVFTSTRQTLLKQDYSYLFVGMKPDLGKDFTEVWTEFVKDLDESPTTSWSWASRWLAMCVAHGQCSRPWRTTA